ncbi:DUF1206 domain-containing protein [Klenkia sp. PcliD-1-E]|uniref:DUF1206 domain-containing protein n=1 Tax=Klenkia sp. PcliD-1-E TaxID=2954492 RepID=UPI0020985E7B|nr:DUF1206 domain-containing protein [Klenkia sp. PcliD-1-E]MCO7220708.1 DUF1206 domain-containing protein [Klenkia sp. PcliD-1-E]
MVTLPPAVTRALDRVVGRIPDSWLERAHAAADRAREVTDHPWLERLAQVGLVAYGLVHLLIGWLAFTVAWRIDPAADDADQAGALQMVSDSPGGLVLLWVIGLGLLSLAVWQAGEVLRWWTGLLHPDRRLHAGFVCAKCLAKAVVYGALAVVALVFAVGARYDATESTQDLTDELLDVPGGAALLVLGGLVVVGVGCYLAWRGWTAGFMKDIDLAAAPDRYEPVIGSLGRVGYLAKSVAFAVAGGLVVFAALTKDISTATGLDGALNTIGAAPAGQWLLTAVAVGFAAFGVYALARARYPDRDPAT